MAVRRAVLRWAARWIQDWLNADDSDRRPGAVLGRCGHPARYVDRRSKRIQSALGELELERAYYHCPHCGTGFCPRDGMLGIEGSLSPAVVRMIASVGAVVSFHEGSQLLEELAGVSLEAKQVERAAEALGSEIAAAEKQDLEPQELDSGRFPDLLRAVRRHADHNEEARKCFQYLHRNRERMRYPQFEAQGLCTGSGVVEAACKGVIGTRLKQSGMRWTVRGANAIIALRCSKLSGRFQDFWERRSGRRAA